MAPPLAQSPPAGKEEHREERVREEGGDELEATERLSPLSGRAVNEPRSI